MPVGPTGHTGRRTSYASVVSGTGNSTSNMRPSGFQHLLNQTTDYALENDRSGSDRRQGADGGSPRTTRGRGTLPSFSSAFAGLVGGPDGDLTPSDSFLVPSYLKNSSYVQRLRAAHLSKPPSLDPLASGRTLSASTSHSNLASKAAHSHGGMTYDLIERAPPLKHDDLVPLPSKWNVNDKWQGLEVISDGLEVKYSGSRSGDRDHEAFSIRADNPMPVQCGIFYYEVTILSRKREESSIGIGFSARDVALNRPPGWEPDSWAYHGDDGNAFASQSSGRQYGPTFTTGDVIGCGVNFKTGCAFFTKNGENLATAFRELKGTLRLFPSIGMQRAGEHIRVNFGQSPFVFDIDSMMNSEILAIREKVTNTSTAKISPLDETSFIQRLVLEYLSHDGYVETARAFAGEVQSEREALHIDPTTPLPSSNLTNIKEDADAVNRQRIRSAIMEGDIDLTLKSINASYPTVLGQNQHIYFNLRCRKFIELMRAAAELRDQTSVSVDLYAHLKKNRTIDGYEDTSQEMEVDDPPVSNGGDNKMEGMVSENGKENGAAKQRANDADVLLFEAIEYGRELNAEFANDSRREVGKRLKECFSLMAYTDPLRDQAMAHLLSKEGRAAVAEEVNSAILVSLGKSSSASLERLIRQTTVLIEELREGGGPGAYVNLDSYMKPKPYNSAGSL